MESKKPVKTNAPETSLLTKARAQIENTLVTGVGLLGLLSTYFISFSGGSRAMSTSVFPRLIYALMVVAGVGMFISKRKYAPPPKEEDVPILFVLGVLAITALYFYAILYVGLVVSTAFFLMALFLLLSPEPRKNIKGLLIACAVGTAVLWVIYTQVVDIFLPNPLLF